MTVISNSKNKTVLHFTSTTTTIVAGNNTVSNIASNSSATVISAAIRKIVHGAQGGYWTLARGANTVAVLTDTGTIDLSAMGLSLPMDSTANVVATLSGGTGFITIELSKDES